MQIVQGMDISIFDRLKMARIYRNITQFDAAHRLGIGQHLFSKKESGKAGEFNTTQLYILIHYYRIDPGFFWGFIHSPADADMDTE